VGPTRAKRGRTTLANFLALLGGFVHQAQ
jgi:hypothetical protein